jgi:hypoxanthine phosphoribosyltransferase
VILYPAADIAVAVERIAAEMAGVVGESHPLLVGVLKGAVPFMADLCRACPFPLEVDFLSISSFGRGRVRIEKDLGGDIEGRHVVVVEDLVDTGLSLGYLVRTLEARGPAVITAAALLDRPRLRLVDVPVRWTGFEVDERYVVGYGMDFEGRYRDLPDIHVVDDLTGLAADPDSLMGRVYSGDPAGGSVET